MIDVSVIISTRNRCAHLTRALDGVAQAAAACRDAAIELIVVDNGSTDDTSRVIAAWAATAPLPTIGLLETRPGLACARNAGVAAASGRLCAFTDDDCIMDPAYMRDLLAHYAHDTQPVIRGGRVDLGDPSDLPFTIKTSAEGQSYQPGLQPGGFILGCNMVVPREIFDRVGLFDELFGAGAPFKAAEETDLVFRAHLAGHAVEYVPDMRVMHFHGRRDKSDVAKLCEGYAIGNGALYAKHFRSPEGLYRHMYWDARKAVRELVSGKIMDADLGLTYRATVQGNLRGMLQFWFRRNGAS